MSALRLGRAGILAVLALAVGCGNSGAHEPSKSDKSGAPGGGAPASTTGQPAPPAAAKFTADQLRKALLTSFDRLTPTDDPDTGVYGALPITQTSLDPRDIPSGVAFAPAKCRSAIWNGPDRRSFDQSPTAFVQFADPEAAKSNGRSVLAWDILIATSGQPADAILGRRTPDCGKVKVTYNGKSMLFEEKKPPPLGAPTRAAFLTPSDSRSRKAWFVTYTGKGYAGMVVLEGPVTAAQVTSFAVRASQQAQRTLG